jgi:ABC-2 type transport system ATP-binding protein
MENSIVKIVSLSHKYSSLWAIKDINLEIAHRGVVGLLGSNGAGKSTTMNIMCGVLNQTQGEVYISGIDIRKQPERAKRLIGFLPQNAPLHLELTVDEYLRHCADLRKLESRKIPAAIAEAKEYCGINHFSKRLIKNLSGGYRQRVGIAQAIVHKPLLVVLDEPTNGLDPNQITEVRNLIKEIGQDRAVIFSSHILSEIQASCREIKMIENGKMVFSDSMDAFNNYIKPHSLLLKLHAPPDLTELTAIPGITGGELLNNRMIRLFFQDDPDITGDIVELSMQKDWQLKEIMLEKSSLDEIFSQLSNNKSKSKI